MDERFIIATSIDTHQSIEQRQRRDRNEPTNIYVPRVCNEIRQS